MYSVHFYQNHLVCLQNTFEKTYPESRRPKGSCHILCWLEVYILQTNIMPDRLCFRPCACEKNKELNCRQRGMGPGTINFCVAAVPGALLRLSRELSPLHTMYVGRKTLIGQNMLDIVKYCNEMKRLILHWKLCPANCWSHIESVSYYWFGLITEDQRLTAWCIRYCDKT
jgi:hypothetical protein